MLLCLCENVCLYRNRHVVACINTSGEKKWWGGHHTHNLLTLNLIFVNITKIKCTVC